jgi:Ca2+-binding EF-hand superfamily protein
VSLTALQGVQISSETTIKALKMLIDRNNSGSITYDEFYAWWSRLVSTSSFKDIETKLGYIEYAATLFWQYDCSADNKLSRDEFKQIYEKLMQVCIPLIVFQ